MNSRAVEALGGQRVDDAYWWAREAIVQAPSFLTPYNTLGAIYQRHGNLKESEQVLAHVLDREPDNIPAMSNLIVVLNGLGRVEESQRWSVELSKMDPDPRFGCFNQVSRHGMAASRREGGVRQGSGPRRLPRIQLLAGGRVPQPGEVEQRASTGRRMKKQHDPPRPRSVRGQARPDQRRPRELTGVAFP
jgi:hypothetical protein